MLGVRCGVPKMASTTWFVVFSDDSKSSVKGTSRFFSWVERRCGVVQFR